MMYCPSCGAEVSEVTNFCSECGEAIAASDEVTGTSVKDYDFMMAVGDGFKRTRIARTLLDLGIILISAGFWFGLIAVEYIFHYYKLKNGEREPYSEGGEKEWFLF